jgi:ferredoxin
MLSTFDGPADIVAPRISIDHGKCTTPMACKRCLLVCPQAVFVAQVTKMAKYVETDINEPGTYKLRPLFQDKCVVCDDCLKACPVDAITITLPQEV